MFRNLPGQQPTQPHRENSTIGKLEGKIALISGGTIWIGLTTAEHFVSEGAHVFNIGLRKPELDAAVAKTGKNVTGFQADETPDLTRQRVEAGVADSVELVQSQESLASADFDYINSVFAHNVAKLSLVRAMGRAAEDLPKFLHVP